MRTLFTHLLILTTGTIVIAQSSPTVDSLDKDIAAHFDQYQPELFRYSGLTIYGETKATFEKSQLRGNYNFLNK